MEQDRPGWNPPTMPTGDVPLSPATHLAAEPAPRGRSRVGTVIAVAAVGIGALGLAGTAYAASTTPSPGTPDGQSAPQQVAPGAGPQGAAPQGGMPGMGGRMGHEGMGGPGGYGMRGFGMGIHSVTTVPKQGGGYQTVHTQNGTVTDVSTSSITVKSEDGYEKKYVVTADTVVNAQRDGIGSVKTTDTVMVVGIENGSDVTAIQIIDRTGVKKGLAPLAPPAPKNSGGTASSSSSGTA